MYTSQRCALRDLFKNYCSYRMIVSCVICKRSLWRNCGVRLLFYYCWFIFIGNKIEKRHKNYSSYEIWWKNFSVLHSDDRQSIFRLEQYYICFFLSLVECFLPSSELYFPFASPTTMTKKIHNFKLTLFSIYSFPCAPNVQHYRKLANALGNSNNGRN